MSTFEEQWQPRDKDIDTVLSYINRFPLGVLAEQGIH